MPFTKNAMLRYRVIDSCLRKPGRLWSLEELQQRCSDALREYAGCSVSLRTLQNDLQFMRSDNPGFNAPIVVREKKYYVYDVPGYSIFQELYHPLPFEGEVERREAV